MLVPWEPPSYVANIKILLKNGKKNIQKGTRRKPSETKKQENNKKIKQLPQTREICSLKDHICFEKI